MVAAASGHEVGFRRHSDHGGDRDTAPVSSLIVSLFSI